MSSTDQSYINGPAESADRRAEFVPTNPDGVSVNVGSSWENICMGFALSSLLATIAGMALVGMAASGAGYGAGTLLVVGILVVSFVSAPLAIISFARKETRALSVFALMIALAPGLFLVGKVAENLYLDYAHDRWLAEAATGERPAGLTEPPYVSVNRETGAVVLTDKPPE